MACFSLAGAAVFSAAWSHSDEASSIDVLTMRSLVFMWLFCFLLMLLFGVLRIYFDCSVNVKFIKDTTNELADSGQPGQLFLDYAVAIIAGPPASATARPMAF